jgi:hypothetical protein
MSKKKKAYTKKVGKDENTYWNRKEMPLRWSLLQGTVFRYNADDGSSGIARKVGGIGWKPSAEFTKTYNGEVSAIANNLSNFGEVLFLIYLIDNVEKDKDYIDLDIPKIMRFLRFDKPNSVYRVIDKFVKLDIIEKRNGGKQRYSFDVFAFYKGVYPEDKVEVATEKKIKKNEQKANRKNADIKSNRAKDL